MTPEEYEFLVLHLSEAFERGDIKRDKYEDTFQAIVALVILLSFLRGSRKTEAQLTPEEWQLINENIQLGHDSVYSFADDIANGRYTLSEEKPKPASLVERAILWAGTALGLYHLGMMFREDDPYLQFVMGPTEHCRDCLRLSGQVHRASAWRNSPLGPQSPNLECRGHRCQCSLVPAEGPSRGSF